MPPTRLYLKQAADPEAARSALRQAISASESFGFANDVVNHRNEYLEWTESVERQLGYLTTDPDVVQMLQTPRHWHIRSSDTSSIARLFPLIEAEVTSQTSTLVQLLADLDERLVRARPGSGQITVLDSNILLEHLPPADVDWSGIVGMDKVRLVVPLRVVEELDAKKYDRRADLADRARRALRALRRVIHDANSPGKLRDNLTIEVPVDPGPRRRPDDADREIIDACHDLQQLSGEAAVLVTADMAMGLRGEAEGIDVKAMPEKYQRRRGDSGTRT